MARKEKSCGSWRRGWLYSRGHCAAAAVVVQDWLRKAQKLNAVQLSSPWILSTKSVIVVTSRYLGKLILLSTFGAGSDTGAAGSGGGIYLGV